MTRKLYQDTESAAVYLEVDGDVFDVTYETDGTALTLLIRGCPFARRLEGPEAEALRAPGGPLSPGREDTCLIAAVADEGEGPGSPFELHVWNERVDDRAAFLLGLDSRPVLYGPSSLVPPVEADGAEVIAIGAKRRREAEIADLHNLSVLTAEMERLGIETVSVEFDGYGDDGEITAVSYAPRAPEGRTIEGFQDEVTDGAGNWSRQDGEPMSFGAAVRNLVYRHLWMNYGGWVNDLGSGGTAEITKEGLRVHFGRRIKSVEWEHGPLHRPAPAPLQGGAGPGF